MKFFKKKPKARATSPAVQRRLTKKQKKGKVSPTGSDVARFLETNKPREEPNTKAEPAVTQDELTMTPAEPPQESGTTVSASRPRAEEGVAGNQVWRELQDTSGTKNPTKASPASSLGNVLQSRGSDELVSWCDIADAIIVDETSKANGTHDQYVPFRPPASISSTPNQAAVQNGASNTPKAGDVSQMVQQTVPDAVELPAQSERSLPSSPKMSGALPADDANTSPAEAPTAPNFSRPLQQVGMVEVAFQSASESSAAEDFFDASLRSDIPVVVEPRSSGNIAGPPSNPQDPHPLSGEYLTTPFGDLAINTLTKACSECIRDAAKSSPSTDALAPISVEGSRSKDACYIPPPCRAPPVPPAASGILTHAELQAIAPWVSDGDDAWSEAVECGSRVNTIVPPKPSSTPFSDLSTNSNAPKLITFLVGQQDLDSRYLRPQFFQIPASYLHYSRALSKYQKCAHDSDVRQKSIIRLPDLDPEAFDMWCEYIATKAIVFPRRITLGGREASKWRWVALWPLVNAHLLSIALEDRGFGDYVLQLLKQKAVKRQTADPETIRHVFSARDISEDLQQFLVGEAIDGGMKNFTPDMIKQYPTAFVVMALDKTVEILGDTTEQGKPENKESSRVGTNTLKQIRHELTRAVVTKDSASARRYVEAQGIKTIDWAERRAREIDSPDPRRDPKTRREKKTRHRRHRKEKGIDAEILRLMKSSSSSSSDRTSRQNSENMKTEDEIATAVNQSGVVENGEKPKLEVLIDRTKRKWAIAVANVVDTLDSSSSGSSDSPSSSGSKESTGEADRASKSSGSDSSPRSTRSTRGSSSAKSSEQQAPHLPSDSTRTEDTDRSDAGVIGVGMTLASCQDWGSYFDDSFDDHFSVIMPGAFPESSVSV